MIAEGEKIMDNEKGVPHANLAALMGERKWKMIDVINRAGIGRNTCARVYREQNLEKMPLGSFLKICDALGCPLYSLLEYYPAKNTDPEKDSK